MVSPRHRGGDALPAVCAQFQMENNYEKRYSPILVLLMFVGSAFCAGRPNVAIVMPDDINYVEPM